MKFKKENVYILKRINHETVKQLIPARTFEYNGHKFNLQGNSKIGYAISDNKSGMLIGTYFEKLKDIEKFFDKLDLIIECENCKNPSYEIAVKKFREAKIEEK